MRNRPIGVDEKNFTPKELAEILKVSVRTIVNEIKRRNLAATLIGRQWRVSKGDLRAYLHARYVTENRK
jgi:excisionase family DNA binding protein